MHGFSICTIIRLEIRWRTHAEYCFDTSCVLLQAAKWNTANDYDVDETRERVLLAHKSEIRKLHAKKQQDGITMFPTAVTYRKGKNNYYKRHALKEKQTKRDIARSMKQY
ncbi:SsrA-binding protein [uncultured Catenibacterium sp.]|uniref:SsrA-binding protein n=1 Tax=uncultured Catenibacterium sp. TaxID=286142 RepID=UPI003457557B